MEQFHLSLLFALVVEDHLQGVKVCLCKRLREGEDVARLLYLFRLGLKGHLKKVRSYTLLSLLCLFAFLLLFSAAPLLLGEAVVHSVVYAAKVVGVKVVQILLFCAVAAISVFGFVSWSNKFEFLCKWRHIAKGVRLHILNLYIYSILRNAAANYPEG